MAFMSDSDMSVVMFFCSALSNAGAFEKPFTEVVFFLIASMMSCWRRARPKSDCWAG